MHILSMFNHVSRVKVIATTWPFTSIILLSGSINHTDKCHRHFSFKEHDETFVTIKPHSVFLTSMLYLLRSSDTISEKTLMSSAKQLFTSQLISNVINKKYLINFQMFEPNSLSTIQACTFLQFLVYIFASLLRKKNNIINHVQDVYTSCKLVNFLLKRLTNFA